jgi:DNA polymerase III alpha subunit
MLTNTINELTIGVLNHGPEILDRCLADPKDLTQYLDILDRERLDYPRPKTHMDRNQWFYPREYQDLDILEFCLGQCETQQEQARVQKEWDLYVKYDMVPVLKCMKYLVDTLRKHQIVWGVGRGSSVASYMLFLIGVHKIDSIKYDLPIEEFFKGE